MAYIRNTPLYPNLSKDINATSRPPLIPESNPKKTSKHAGDEIIPLDVYENILLYLNSELSSAAAADSGISQFRHAQNMPHPENAKVLPRSALPLHQFQHKGRGYSTVYMHPGNSSVFFNAKSESGADSGHIEAIWNYDLSHVGVQESHRFVVLAVHQGLSPQDTERNPYRLRPGLLANVVYAYDSKNVNRSLMIVKQDDIVGHAAYYSRPSGTFGINRATTVIVNSLHRYRD